MLTITNLNKIYITGDIRVHALKDVNFHIEKGEFVAIMGTSGSGKSTLMNLLGCLDRATSGKYILDGVDVSKSKDSELSNIRSKKIGFVFQSYNLLPNLTLLENVELPMMYAHIHKKEREIKAMEYLTIVGLGDRVKHRPNEVSGGQKQRVAIARSLANNPAIILADEPTGNLDSKTETEILKIFLNLNNNGSTIILVTHELSVAQYAKRIITFKDGEIISDVENTPKYGEENSF